MSRIKIWPSGCASSYPINSVKALKGTELHIIYSTQTFTVDQSDLHDMMKLFRIQRSKIDRCWEKAEWLMAQQELRWNVIHVVSVYEYVRLTLKWSLQHESGTWQDHSVSPPHANKGLLFQSVTLYKPQQLNCNTHKFVRPLQHTSWELHNTVHKLDTSAANENN